MPPTRGTGVGACGPLTQAGAWVWVPGMALPASQPPVQAQPPADADVSVAQQRRSELCRSPTGCGPSAQGALDPCVPRVWLRAFNVTLIATAFAVTIYSIKEFDDITAAGDPEIYREKMRLIGLAVSMVGLLIWPVLFDTLAGYAIMTHHPLTIFGFAWPMIMNLLDLGYTASTKNASQAQKVYGIGEISGDANTLVGVAFAVGSLLMSQSNSGLADATIPLLMYALLFLIAFIVPIPSLDPNDYSGFFVGAVQRTFFNYAMGFVIAGISINISGQTGRGLQSALQRICLLQQVHGYK